MADRFHPIGSRLLEAYKSKGILSKKQIAEKLGFKSEAAVYKVINGERELGFDSLIRFGKTTGRSIDWLLTGEEPKVVSGTLDNGQPAEGHPRDRALKELVDRGEIREEFAQILDEWAARLREDAKRVK